MSRPGLNLSHPAVVGGVFVVLATLIAVNVRTFAPHRSRARTPDSAEVRVQAHPSLPLDLEDVLHQAGHSSAGLGEPVTGPRPAVHRDPFLATAIGLPDATPDLPTSAKPANPARHKGDPVCAAVMLGSGAPAALIDGRLCRVGDRTGSFTIEAIDRSGVTLGGERKLFLPVGAVSSGEGVHVVVTGAVTGDRLGRTSLVEHAESEKK